MGTLGMPAPRQTLLAFSPTIEASGEAVAGMVRDGVQPCTLELRDAFTIRAVNASCHLRLVVSARDAAEADLLRQGRRMAHALDPLGILNPGKVL